MGEQLLGLATTWVWSAAGVAGFERAIAQGRDWRQWNHAVIFGMLGAVAGGTPSETLLAYFHQAIMGIIEAGVRAVPVGHTRRGPMGPRTARITAEDFLIPHEFRAYRLAERFAGQIGGVRLELRQAGDRTCLGACYQQVPLRVLPPFHFEGEPASLLYLLNPTAGLMDGDGHLVEIEAGPGTTAVPSCIHPFEGGSTISQRLVA